LLKKISVSPHKNVILGRKTKDLWTVLHCAAQNDNKAFIEAVFAAGGGLDIDSRNVHGDTPLHIAAARGNKLVVETLLRKGANPKIKNKSGATVLDIAHECCRHIISKALQKRINFASASDLDEEELTQDEVLTQNEVLTQDEVPAQPARKRTRVVEEVDGSLAAGAGSSGLRK
jgi:ankyrin repeat protein